MAKLGIEAQKFEVLKMRILVLTDATFPDFMANSAYWRFRSDRAPVWMSPSRPGVGVEVS